VTIAIPVEFRDIAKLTYVPGPGDYAIAFVPRDSRPETHFAGGVAICQAMCLSLVVSWSRHTEQLGLEFGEGACGVRSKSAGSQSDTSIPHTPAVGRTHFAMSARIAA
jgi:hypothetical protein